MSRPTLTSVHRGKLLVMGKGTLFDPDVVDAFRRVEGQWRQIAADLDDSTYVEGLVE